MFTTSSTDMDTDTDKDTYYIKDIQNGNISSYSYLVHKYKNLVFNLVYRILKNREDSEEVSQDAFVNAFNVINEFNFKAKFSTWIYKIAYNAAISRLRHKKTFSFLKTNELEDNFTDDDSYSIENILQLELDEKKEIIQKLLSELNEEENVLIALYYFNDCSIQEISEITSLTVSNVKIKLYRTRKLLMNNLKKWLGKEYEYWK